jgi:hypothetical protein
VRFLPAWFPGTSFHQVALRCKLAMSEIEAAPYAWALAKIVGLHFLFLIRIFTPDDDFFHPGIG